MMNIENIQTIKQLKKFVKLSKQLQTSWHFLKNIRYSLEAHHFSGLSVWKFISQAYKSVFICNNLSKIQLCVFARNFTIKSKQDDFCCANSNIGSYLQTDKKWN